VEVGDSFAQVVARYTADGVLDPDFGNAGIATGPVGVGVKLLIQPDQKLIVAGGDQTTDEIVVARFEATGSLDASFGDAGVVRTVLPVKALGAALQPDGKIIVVGGANSDTGYDVVLVRYTAGGALDDTFGTDGVVTTDVVGDCDFARDAAVQSDGSIIVAGFAGSGTDCFSSLSQVQFAVLKYQPDGDLDTAFGSEGVVLVSLSGHYDGATVVSVEPSGAIVAAGFAGVDDHFVPFGGVVRLLSDGTRDPSFGNAGTLVVPTGPVFGQAFDRDGKIVLVGDFRDPDGYTHWSIERRNVDGTPDPTFGGAGRVMIGFPSTGSNQEALSVVIRADQRIIVAGVGAAPTSPVAVLARFLGGTCGDGFLAGGEGCDDGNALDGDCCSSTCRFEPAGGACNDGNACTSNDACNDSGSCIGAAVACPACESCAPDAGCTAHVLPDCHRPVKRFSGQLSVVSKTSTLKWRWATGQATAVTDFGDPLAGDRYALCLFDESTPTPQVVFRATTHAGVCGARTCWKTAGARGFAYRDLTRTRDGIDGMSLHSGADGNANISASAGGSNVALPGLPLRLPARMQLQAENGECWEARYFDLGTSRNDGAHFTAKAFEP
jgi:uncharacterized delta-60 repeat protein